MFSPEEIGVHYDQVTEFYRILFGGNFHVGYWPEGLNDSIHHAQERLTELVLSRLNVSANQKVLDVGCGVGWPAIRLARSTGALVTGINVSRGQLEIAQKRAQEEGLADRVKFEYANAMTLPYADQSFDAAMAYESMFHMPDRNKVLSEIFRVLRPGGRLVVADFISTSKTSEEERRMQYAMYKVNSYLFLNEYPEFFQRAGFEVVECKDISRETEKSMDKFLEVIPPKRDEIAAVYGAAFVDGMVQNWPALKEQYLRTTGYALVVGCRPKISA